jgi:chemotaxis signal transduction protein
MNFGCTIRIEPARFARDPRENENGDQRALASFTEGNPWLGREQSTTTPNLIGPKQWFCLFCADASPLAVSLESVSEVLDTDTLVQLPWSPPQVVGMCSYHREVVPVVTLGPPRDEVGEVALSGQDQTIAMNTPGETVGDDGRARCVLLIFKTEHGAWGIRINSENTIISRESPDWHSPRTHANGPVLVGIVHLAGTDYQILDAEATWRALRSEVGRWTRFVSESKPLSLRPGHEPYPADHSASRQDQEA